MRRGELVLGETVLIMGAGMIGLGALMGARRAGARVIAFDLSDAKLETALQLGADAVINAASPNWRDRLAELTPEGPDLVIEAVGAEATFLQAVEVASSCGRVVYIGYAKSAIAYDTKQFITKELDIRGSRNALPVDFGDVVKYLRAIPVQAISSSRDKSHSQMRRLPCPSGMPAIRLRQDHGQYLDRLTTLPALPDRTSGAMQ